MECAATVRSTVRHSVLPCHRINSCSIRWPRKKYKRLRDRKRLTLQLRGIPDLGEFTHPAHHPFHEPTDLNLTLHDLTTTPEDMAS